MANTPSFNWQTPDDTSLVKDGASAMRTLGNAIDTSMTDLLGGTTGQVLSKASNTDMDFTWVAQDDSNAIQNAIVDAKGDLISATAADTPARLAVGTNGQVLTADSTTATGLKWATPATATTWTYRSTSTGNVMNKIEYNGSNLYCAVGANGYIYGSSDGITWTSRTAVFGSTTINDIAYGNGLWVAVGNAGTLATSSDGSTWTLRTSNMGTSAIRAVTYANSLWVAVGDDGGTTNTGGIIYSTDGITWTRKSQSVTINSTYRSVIWNGTNWIVGADFSTNNYLYASTPSGTWTAGHTGSSGSIYQMIWDGTRHITWEAASYTPRYSTSTTLGTTTAYNAGHRNTNSNIGAAYLYNGQIYSTNGYYWGQMTPSSSANLTSMTSPQIAPQTLSNSTPWIAGGAGSIFAGSIGLIFANPSGIWTSF